jgi:hypothetical protein
MDLKQYFRKLNDTQALIEEQYPLIVSLETSDGGKAGVIMEVSRQEAARAIVESRGVLANDEQKKAYFDQEAGRKKSAEKAELSRRLQVAIISESDLRNAVAQSKKEEEPKGSK